MERIVGIYFRNQMFYRERPGEGHKEVAERIIKKFNLKFLRGDPVDFLIDQGAIKIGNRYGNDRIIIFRGLKIDNGGAKIIEHYQNCGWKVTDMDIDVNWL